MNFIGLRILINGKQLEVSIINGDGALFSVMEAKPFPVSPVVEGQSKNEEIRKLTVHIPDCRHLNLCINIIEHKNIVKTSDYVALDDWRI